MRPSRVAAALVAAALLLGGCAGHQRIRDLRIPVAVESDTSNGTLSGLDALIAGLPSDQDHINVLFVHGIGYTEADEGSKGQFGAMLVDAIHDHYRAVVEDDNQQVPCEKRGFHIVHGKQSVSPTLSLPDDPNTTFHGQRLGCLDLTVMTVAGGKKIYIYRYLWDDTFYLQAEFRTIGYDDAKYVEAHSEKIAKLRRSVNRTLKDDVVSYGLTDAALYMGQAGSLMREGLKGAICAVVNERSTNFGVRDDGTLPEFDLADLCTPSGKAAPAPFVLMSHSLGSRIAFDVLHSDLEEPFASFLRNGLAGQPEIRTYMLANQLPLVALGRLTRTPPKVLSPAPRPLRFIAFSEVNDLLTYELVPYFEHLYWLRCSRIGVDSDERIESPKDCDVAEQKTGKEVELELQLRRAALGPMDELVRGNVKKKGERGRFVDELGFEVMDVRVDYQGPLLGLLPFLANPISAHSNYLKDGTVRRVIFCGVIDGKPIDCTWPPPQ